ncbi:MAG: hypothetical protein BWY54_00634 [Candidatus Dependentiae bacterium ADurb.Bin331]|nr:MAG: hypothetical protein BWY54_00634 [Candidatus Dependentiae bacterium ADurb.Bin331]
MIKRDTMVLLLILFCRVLTAMEHTHNTLIQTNTVPPLLDTPFARIVDDVKNLIFHHYQLANGKSFISDQFYVRFGKRKAYIEIPTPIEQFPRQRHAFYQIEEGLPGLNSLNFEFIKKKFRTYYIIEKSWENPVALFSEKRNVDLQSNYLPVPSQAIINNNGFVAFQVIKPSSTSKIYLINIDKIIKRSTVDYLAHSLFNKKKLLNLGKKEFLAAGISPFAQMILTLSRNPERQHIVRIRSFSGNSDKSKKISFDKNLAVRSLWWGPQNSIIAYLLKSKSLSIGQVQDEQSVESYLIIYDTKNDMVHQHIDLGKWINDDPEGERFFQNAQQFYRFYLKNDQNNIDNEQEHAETHVGKRASPLINRATFLYPTQRFVDLQFSVEIAFGKAITIHDFLTAFPAYVLYDYEQKKLFTIDTPTERVLDVSRRKSTHSLTVSSNADLKKMVYYFINNPGHLFLINEAYNWLHDENRSTDQGNEILKLIHNKNLVSNKWQLLWAATVGKKYDNNYFRKIHELVKNGTSGQSPKNRS